MKRTRTALFSCSSVSPSSRKNATAADTCAPVGAPVAVRATDWLAPAVTAVEIVPVADEPATTFSQAEALANAPAAEGGLFIVPQVI